MRSEETRRGRLTARSILVAVLPAILLMAHIAAEAGEASSGHGVTHWGYGEREGPENWSRLNPEYRLCGLGRYQSPIDIPMAQVRRARLEPIHFDYNTVPLRVIDSGHTIQVNYGPGSTIRVGSHQYQLTQFHFHHPSEERINGKAYPMVAHLVHRDQDGRIAVIAAMLVEGRDNPLFQTVLDHLSEPRGREATVLFRPINAERLLPTRRDYYTYIGSLTTPPCSEGVNWYVLRHPVEVSREDLDRFSRLYRNNARPVQPINGRLIRAGG